MKNDMDVMVVGGGPVGLVLACELRLAGLCVLVLERRLDRVAESRALTLHGRTLEMLGLRGVASRFLAQGRKIPKGHFAGLATTLDFSVCETDFPFTLFLPQSVTEQLLEEWAIELGVEIRRGAVVESITQDSDRVIATGHHNGAAFKSMGQFLVGADGARSRTRQQAHIAFPGISSTQTMILGDVTLDAAPDTPAISVGNAAGHLMLGHLGGSQYRIVLIDAQRLDMAVSVPATLSELKSSTQRITGTDFGMRDPVWLSRFSNETRLADRYQNNRIFLAGDAAHIHFPAGGQGMNVGMQDAMNLAWKVAGVVNGYAPASLLTSYENERRLVGQSLYRSTLTQNALMTGFDAAGQALRETMCELLTLPTLNAKLANELSAFGIGYAEPLISSSDDWVVEPQWTGKRLSNWPLRLANGKLVALHELMHQGKWLLMRFTSEGNQRYEPQLDKRWIDTIVATPELHAQDVLGLDAMLVRPDGHVDHAVRYRATATM